MYLMVKLFCEIAITSFRLKVISIYVLFYFHVSPLLPPENGHQQSRTEVFVSFRVKPVRFCHKDLYGRMCRSCSSHLMSAFDKESAYS